MDNNNFINPKAPTLAATYNSSISSAASITLNSGTTVIYVTAIDKGVFMRWGATVSSSAFDEFIPANTTRAFVVLATSAQFIQEAATGKVAVVEK